MTGAKASPALLPAYLLLGTDELKRRTALERLQRRLEVSGDPTFNSETVEGGSCTDPGALRSSLDTLPFGADFRLVVVRDVDKAPKAVAEAIVSYLGSPSPTTVLAMTAEKLARNTRLYKAIDKVGPKAVVDCAPKKRWELPEQVSRIAAAHGKRMGPEAAELLVRLVGESTTMLDTEVGKLAVAVGAAPSIETRDIERNVTRVAEVRPWDFLDAVSRREPAEAMRMLGRMPSQNLVGLYVLLVTRLRELICAKALAARGCPGQLASELGLAPQLAWKVKNHATWARNYAMDELVGALRSGVECERALKSAPDKTRAIQCWVLSFCTPRG